MRKKIFSPARAGWAGFGLAAVLLAAGPSLWAQPTNDNFADAEVLTGSWGSVANDNTTATPEPGEPSHAGFPAAYSIWYQWTAPADGEVTFDTIGSMDAFGLEVDTVLAVYTGSNLTQLAQVAANDNTHPAPQQNAYSFNGASFIGAFIIPQSFDGPSVLRFSAKAGTTYYIAVDSKFSLNNFNFANPFGSISLNWAFHPSGVFRFATEDQFYDPLQGAIFPVYQVSEDESSPMSIWASTYETYYKFDVPGLLVTVTRVGGSSGRMLVDFATADMATALDQDLPAVGGMDYMPVQGTLVFDDFEMSKDIVIPIMSDFGMPNFCRDFELLLSNPRPDTNESPLVAAPRVDPVYGRAIVRILDTDIDGNLENNYDTNGVFTDTTNAVLNFAKSHYRVPEDINDYWSTVLIDVVRSGTNRDGVTISYSVDNYFLSEAGNTSELDNNLFPLQPGSDYATPTPPNSNFILGKASDFNLVHGTLSWGQNDFRPKTISLTVANDLLTEFNEDFHLMIYKTVDPGNRRVPVGTVNDCTVTILFDDRDPPAGSVDQFHNADYGVDMVPAVATTPPQLPHPGVDDVVYDLAVQTDNKSVIVGQFSTCNTIGRNKIARLNTDGSVDETFTPGLGGDDFISCISLLANNQMMIGGAFTAYDGNPITRVARVNANGTCDTSFNPGVPGINGPVWAMAVQSDGKIVIGGEFTSVGGFSRPHIARLNADGSLDETFDPATNAPNGTVNALALMAGGRIAIGGDFTALGTQTANYLARLNSNGTLDSAFSTVLGGGLDGAVYALAVANGQLLAGGEFLRVSDTARPRIARFTASGSLDATFDPGTGADNTVYSITPQTDGTIYVGGIFRSFNGTRRAGFTRLYADGTVDTGFMDTAYNHFAGLPMKYFHKETFGDPTPFVFAAGVQSDGHVMIGGGFDRVGGGQVNRTIRLEPETFPTNTFNVNVWTEPKARDGIRNRSNVARLLGGTTDGPGNVGLLYSSYNVNRSQSFLFGALTRTNGTLGYASANFSVPSGLAQAGMDFTYNSVPPVYLSTWRLGALVPGIYPNIGNSTTRMKTDGLLGTNAIPVDTNGRYWFGYTPGQVVVSVINAGGSAGDVATSFRLANPAGADQFFLGGANIPLGTALGRSTAPFTIRDDTRKTNYLGFAFSNFYVNEGGTNATITIVRTNGTAGSCTVHYNTADDTARAGSNYLARSGNLTFGSGAMSRSFDVPIIDDNASQPNGLTVKLQLSAISGASYAIQNAVLNIIDNDGSPGVLNFAPSVYGTNLSAGAVVLNVTRGGANRGTLSVQCVTSNGSPVISGPITNTLLWNNLDATPRSVALPLVNNGAVGPNTTFSVYFANPILNSTSAPAAVLGSNKVATVTITNDNSYGILQFSSDTFFAKENGGYATITVTRRQGAAQAISVNYATAPGTAVSSGPVRNFVATAGTLSFQPGEISKSFNVPLLDDGLLDPADFYFFVNLSGDSPAGVLGAPATARVYIRDAFAFNEPAGSVDTSFNPVPGLNGEVNSIALQPDGKIVVGGAFTLANNSSRNRIARFNADSSLDSDFLSGYSGANAAVQAVLVQTDGRVLAGGSFTTINGVNKTRIARLANNGYFDTSFNQGSGADNTVYAIAETFSGNSRRILIGGAFRNVNSSARPGLARLLNDGSLDPDFNPGLDINGTVYALAVYPTNTVHAGKILIGGDFTAINGFGINRLARLTPAGFLDPTFNPGTGASAAVRALALQSDGKVLVGGSFTNFNNTPFNRIVRLTADGLLDGTFNVGVGADDTVEAIAVQPDGRILLAGQFVRASGVSRSRITRLLPDGSVDPAINFGAGANNSIHAVAVQPDGMILIGGSFTLFDGNPRPHLARLYGGSLAGSGSFEFVSGQFQVDENATNAVITIRRQGGTAGDMAVDFATSDGTAIAGVNYSNVAVTLAFQPGETYRTVSVPVRSDLQITPDLTVNLTLSSPLPPSGLGTQPTAILTILNDDAGISFSSPTYAVNEDVVGGGAFIQVLRQGSTQGTATVEFLTTTNGTAVPGINYTPVTNTTLTFLPGESNLTVRVSVLRSLLADGDKTVVLQLTNANNSLLFSPNFAVLSILDVERLPGDFVLASTNLVVSEAAGTAAVTVLRTNGYTGPVSVNFATVAGTALPGLKYTETNGVLNFADNETSKTIYVPILQETQVEGNQTFLVRLFSPTGGATLPGATNALVTILDDDVGVHFLSQGQTAIYIGPETAGSISLTVERIGTNDITTVNYATTNGTAQAGTNYVAASGTLTFAPGESIKSFSVSVLNDPRVTGDLDFTVNLLDPSAPAQLFSPSSALVTVLDSNPGISFGSTNISVVTNADFTVVTNAEFAVLKSATNVLISVLRSNANTGVVSVNYATTNGTALAGVDYTPASGSLVFSNGVVLQTFTVPIINNRVAAGDRVFGINLFTNAQSGPVQLIPPSVASVTITDDIAGLTFSGPVYSVNENGVATTITVLRTGFTNSTVSVDYATADGTAVAGVNYLATSGTFTFTNGETAKTFSVQVIDNSVLDGDKTVLLQLRNPTGNSVLGDNSAATLIILETDGSLVIPAGAALVAESGPVNGMIDTNETVTMLLGLRNASGTNTTNLQATLLATNGVLNPSGPQNYGVLTVHGPSVSRPFTFSVSGTNGQVVAATLRLTDSDSTNDVVFNFVLGRVTTVFSNPALITINDETNASPYPSTVTVNGLGGVVSKASVMITNLNHTYPSDVDIVLVSPSGQKSYLMAASGGSHTIKNVTLTFDQDAPSLLSQTATITSGVYKATSYATPWPPFPVPAPPPPYATNLAAFNGSNPNGTWSLYVLDGKAWDMGFISNGWSLILSTTGPVPTAADVGISMTMSPSTVVSGTTATYQIAVTNHGPSTASNVIVTNVLPAGAVFIAGTPTTGTVTTNNAGQVSWSVGTLTLDAYATLVLEAQLNTLGTATNTASVTSSTLDPNPDDDRAVATATVVSPTADLVLTLVGSPNPATQGGTVTYSITVTNAGPATAPGLVVSDNLPAGLGFVSASPSGYRRVGSVVTFTNLGSVPVGGQLSATIVASATSAGTFTNIAICSSAVVDPLKGNNTALVKTVVEASGPLPPPVPLLTIYRYGSNVVIAWPLAGGYSNLDWTAGLQPPVWSQVTNPISISGAEYRLTNAVEAGSRFYRPR